MASLTSLPATTGWPAFLKIATLFRSLTISKWSSINSAVSYGLIEHASAQPGAMTTGDPQDTSLRRVNELLRTLAPRSSGSANAGEDFKTSISFFEKLDLVTDTYMQEEKKPSPS
jgi:hypothetical protein